MPSIRVVFLRWVPALAWMAAIFASSATPAAELPHFGIADYVVKKGGHFGAYALLALAYRRALGSGNRRIAVAGLLTVGYALLDEYHQSFVPGRHPSWTDALVFDAAGALAALLLTVRFTSKRVKQGVSSPKG